MRGIVGCDADLEVGDVIGNGVTTMIVRGRVSEDEARRMAEELGAGPVAVVPGERFYEVEVQRLAPMASNN